MKPNAISYPLFRGWPEVPVNVYYKVFDPGWDPGHRSGVLVIKTNVYHDHEGPLFESETTGELKVDITLNIGIEGHVASTEDIQAKFHGYTAIGHDAWDWVNLEWRERLERKEMERNNESLES